MLLRDSTITGPVQKGCCCITIRNLTCRLENGHCKRWCLVSVCEPPHGLTQYVITDLNFRLSKYNM